MIAGQIALVLTSAFAGAAFYIGFAKHPARLGLDDKNLLKQWKPCYAAGYTMQASLAAAACGFALLEGWLAQDWRWIVGAASIIANWPYTLLIMMPVNHRLQTIADDNADFASRHAAYLGPPTCPQDCLGYCRDNCVCLGDELIFSPAPASEYRHGIWRQAGQLASAR